MSQRRGPTNGKSNGSGSGLGKFLLCCWPTQEEAVVHEEPMVQARTVQDKTPRITATPVQSVLTETLQVKTVPAKPTTIDHSQPKPIPVKPAQVGAPQAKAVPGQTTTSKGRLVTNYLSYAPLTSAKKPPIIKSPVGRYSATQRYVRAKSNRTSCSRSETSTVRHI